MSLISCRNAEELSCMLANLIFETRLPCGVCAGANTPIITGTAFDGHEVTVRILPENVLEVIGADTLLEEIRKRRCACHG
ncbi:MAG: hypothetical protein RR365_04005 [Bacteroides sp.]